MKSCGELEFVLPKAKAEAFCVWAREAFGAEPVWLERPGGETAVVVVYGADERQAAAWARKGVPAEFGVVSARARRCDEREWTGFWKHHFKTADVGRRLRVVPVWEKAPDRKRVNLKIDPGLSFGTGMHFTTRFCLEQLEEALKGSAGMSVLDAGSGSGILAIAAAKLGAGRIDAYDVDPVCVRRFAANRRLNYVPPSRIRYELGNVMDWGGGGKRYDVVCANILSHLLIRAAARLWGMTARRLVLAGIRDAEADEVADAFLRLGAREWVRDSDGEWCGLVMERGRH